MNVNKLMLILLTEQLSELFLLLSSQHYVSCFKPFIYSSIGWPAERYVRFGSEGPRLEGTMETSWKSKDLNRDERALRVFLSLLIACLKFAGANQ